MKGGFGYTEFAKGTNIEYGKLQRELLVEYLSENPDVKTLPTMGRLNYRG